MAIIPKFLEDLSIISKLGDNPGSDNNLSTSGFRAKFDEAGLAIQSYINNILLPKLEEVLALTVDPSKGLTMAGPINMNGKSLTGLAEPKNNADAVTLEYAEKTYAKGTLADEVRTAKTVADNAASTASSAASTASTAQTTASGAASVAAAALPRAGGDMTGPLLLQGIRLTAGTDYGTALPENPVTGQIFFLDADVADEMGL